MKLTWIDAAMQKVEITCITKHILHILSMQIEMFRYSKVAGYSQKMYPAKAKETYVFRLTGYTNIHM